MSDALSNVDLTLLTATEVESKGLVDPAQQLIEQVASPDQVARLRALGDAVVEAVRAGRLDGAALMSDPWAAMANAGLALDPELANLLLKAVAVLPRPAVESLPKITVR